MPKVSVIIPVYNASQYISKCLDSIINQTLKDIEIICVNDCSTDNTLEILNNNAKNDKRIKIINHETNGGESKARNTGLENAKGEYLAFVDNDDTIDPDFLEKLYDKAKETGAEIVKAEAHIFETNGTERFDGLNKQIKQNLSKLFFSSYWWCAIYKKELITKNKIKFIEGFPLGGDVLFLNEAILKCNFVELVDGTYYNYYRRDDSGDSKILPIEKIHSALEIHEKIIDNTKNELSVQNDITGLKHIFGWCFNNALYYAYRNKSTENLKYCVDKMIDFYKKTQEYLDNSEVVKKSYPVVVNYIKAGDKENLFKLYLENNSPQKMFIANLRYLHKQSK